MKIIKHGNVPKAQVTCPHCGCEFEYERKDVYTELPSNYAAYPTIYHYYVRCPECGKKITSEIRDADEYPSYNPI